MGCCISSSLKKKKEKGEGTATKTFEPVKSQDIDEGATNETKDNYESNNYTLPRRKFVEDVTEEELFEQEEELMKQKNKNLIPGPGELWMEPVE